MLPGDVREDSFGYFGTFPKIQMKLLTHIYDINGVTDGLSTVFIV